MKRLWIAALLVAACRGGGGSGAPAVTVTITAPADGDTITGTSVPVTLAAAGIEIAPASDERRGTAHHHLFFDVDLTAPGDTIPAGVTGIRHLGRGQTEFLWDSVPPGPHRIIAMLADAWHVPLAPLAVDTINVVVKP